MKDRDAQEQEGDGELSQSVVSADDDVTLQQRRRFTFRLGCLDGLGPLLRLILMQGLASLAIYSIIINVPTYGAFLSFTKVSSSQIALFLQAILFLPGPIFGWLGDRKVSKFRMLFAGFFGILLGLTLVTIIAGVSMAGLSHRHKIHQAVYFVGAVLVALSGAVIYVGLFPYMLEHARRLSHRVLAGFCTWAYFSYGVGTIIVSIPGGILQMVDLFPNSSSNEATSASRHCRMGYTGFVLAYSLAILASILALFILFRWRKSFEKDVNTTLEYRLSLRAILKSAFTKHPRAYYQGMYDRAPLLPFKTQVRQSKRKMTEELQKRLSVIVLPLMTMIIYGCVVQVTYVLYVEQGERLNISFKHLNHNLSSCKHFNFLDLAPPITLSAFNSLALVLVLPIIYFFINNVFPLNHLSRIRWGMILAALSLMCASLVEWERTRIFSREYHKGYVVIANTTLTFVYVNLSFLYQIPQHVLMGLSQGLVLVASVEFVLSRAPPGYRAITLGFLNMCTGVGVVIGLCIGIILKKLSIAYPTIPTTYQKEKTSKPYVFYLTLLYLLIFNIAFYLWVEYRHKDIQRRLPSSRRPSSERLAD